MPESIFTLVAGVIIGALAQGWVAQFTLYSRLKLVEYRLTQLERTVAENVQ